jgi:hypothetical protein
MSDRRYTRVQLHVRHNPSTTCHYCSLFPSVQSLTSHLSTRLFLPRCEPYSSLLRSTFLYVAHRGARLAALLRVLLGNKFTTVMEFLERELCLFNGPSRHIERQLDPGN